jgi:hypothetical protein
MKPQNDFLSSHTTIRKLKIGRRKFFFTTASLERFFPSEIGEIAFLIKGKDSSGLF